MSMRTSTISPGATRQLKNHTSFKQSVRNSLTMAYRGILKIRRTPEQLFDVTLQPIIFTLMFTYIFGGAISGDVVSYLPVIIPGILVQTVITTSIVTGVQLREDMDKGVFDRFKSLPIARIAPLAGLCWQIQFDIRSQLCLLLSWAILWVTDLMAVWSMSQLLRFWLSSAPGRLAGFSLSLV